MFWTVGSTQICIFEGIADSLYSNQYVFLNLMYLLGYSKENRKHQGVSSINSLIQGLCPAGSWGAECTPRGQWDKYRKSLPWLKKPWNAAVIIHKRDWWWKPGPEWKLLHRYDQEGQTVQWKSVPGTQGHPRWLSPEPRHTMASSTQPPTSLPLVPTTGWAFSKVLEKMVLPLIKNKVREGREGHSK